MNQPKTKGKAVKQIYVVLGRENSPGVFYGDLAQFDSLSKKCQEHNQRQHARAGITEINGTLWVNDGYDWQTRQYNKKPLDINKTPRVIDNDPTSGFKFVGINSRYSTANKYWLVEDPRGFVIEVPTANAEDIVNTCKIEYGVIITPCVWVFANAGIGKPKLVRA
jgi:hypothetical protein